MRCLVAAVLAGSILFVGVSQARPIGNVTTSGYAQWRGASPDTKAYVVQVAFSGLETGWIFGSGHAQGKIAGYLVSEYRKGALPARIASHAGQMSVADPPLRHARPVRYYVNLIDRAYRRLPAVRSWDVPSLLLCLSDRPLPGCPSSLTAIGSK